MGTGHSHHARVHPKEGGSDVDAVELQRGDFLPTEMLVEILRHCMRFEGGRKYGIIMLAQCRLVCTYWCSCVMHPSLPFESFIQSFNHQDRFWQKGLFTVEQENTTFWEGTRVGENRYCSVNHESTNSRVSCYRQNEALAREILWEKVWQDAASSLKLYWWRQEDLLVVLVRGGISICDCNTGTKLSSCSPIDPAQSEKVKFTAQNCAAVGGCLYVYHPVTAVLMRFMRKGSKIYEKKVCDNVIPNSSTSVMGTFTYQRRPPYSSWGYGGSNVNGLFCGVCGFLALFARCI